MVGITRNQTGVDSAWEQEKPEARKMLDAKRAAESPASSNAVLGGGFGIRKYLDGFRGTELISDHQLIGVGVAGVDMLRQAGGTL